jgi:hypothetical protein
MMTHRVLPADLDAYCSLIDGFLTFGYSICGFENIVSDQPHLVLRHDVDISLPEAAAMAERERRLGAAATYFIQARCDLYNPAAPASRAALDTIAQCGHEIGLHLDASPHGENEEALEKSAEEECAAIEQVTGRPVRFISFHRPAKHLLGRAEPLAGRRHAYEPAFFTDIGYCSDSQGAWRHGHPLEHPATSERRALQLLTHPIWWAGSAGTPEAALDASLRRKLEAIADEYARIRQGYDAPKIDLARP